MPEPERIGGTAASDDHRPDRASAAQAVDGTAANSSGLDLLASVLRKTGDILSRIADQELEMATPCSEYDVRQVRDHLIGWGRTFAAWVADEAPLPSDGPNYRAGRDAVNDYREMAEQLVTTLRARGHRILVGPHGPMAPAVLADEMLAEVLIHGWDLATATRRSTSYTPEEIAAAHAGLTAMLAEPYAPEGFRPPITVDRDASELAVLLARSGRVPERPVCREVRGIE